MNRPKIRKTAFPITYIAAKMHWILIPSFHWLTTKAKNRSPARQAIHTVKYSPSRGSSNKPRQITESIGNAEQNAALVWLNVMLILFSDLPKLGTQFIMIAFKACSGKTVKRKSNHQQHNNDHLLTTDKTGQKHRNRRPSQANRGHDPPDAWIG